jgi:hypothetical protein
MAISTLARHQFPNCVELEWRPAKPINLPRSGESSTNTTKPIPSTLLIRRQELWFNIDGDRLYGGVGADLVRGGEGSDYLEGGKGFDVYDYTAG